jgi:hypothetical protein
MTKNDRNILILFFSIFIFFYIISIIAFLTGNISLVGLADGLFISIFFGLGITGILSYIYYRKNAIIPTKKLLKWSALIALPIAIVPTLLVLLLAIPDSDLPTNIGMLLGMAFGLFIVMFLMVLLVIIVLVCFGFGMVGVLAALVRAIAPEVLLHVLRISANRSAGNHKNKKESKLSTIDSIINWAFAIPDVLDTKTLKINQGRPRNWFPWPNLYKAIFWQLLFGTVIIIYISFNPLYVKSELDFQYLFSIAANFTIIVPFFILPWFIFLRLDSKIKGQVKDYELYRGIIYRMYQTFFTLGTILIIIRLGLEEIDSTVILLALPMYYLFYISIIFLVSYIYFNYFENGLAWEVAKSYKKIKD